ncbi:MAG: thiamine pyrophosphate-dependent enzyme [Pseudomonadota bacterium]
MADKLLASFRHMHLARAIDRTEAQFVASGEAFFTVSGAGHEASCLLQHCLGPQDWLHCHYRDKALMLARGVSARDFFTSVLCRAGGHSNGRQMSAHMSDPSLNILSIVGPVGNQALQAVGVAASIKDQPKRPLVLCAMGDGTTQQGEVYEAMSEAANEALPVLFLIEDNQFSISVPTVGRTFYSQGGRDASSFFGIPITYVNGWEPQECLQVFERTIANIRDTRGPSIVVMRTERLSDHTNADDQSVYRNASDIEEGHQHRDPIDKLAAHLLDQGVSQGTLDDIEHEVALQVQDQAQQAMDSENPQPMFEAKRPLPPKLAVGASEYSGTSSGQQVTMTEAINGVLENHLSQDGNTFLYGEDIEDPKGDVFGVTKGLSTAFPQQVKNSPLSEATIMGTAIGRSLAGQRVVAFLQFADFLPLAFNQIISELGSMYWRSNGGWNCPVIVMITCGGYRPGLGPFHAQTLEAVAAHTPGVDVMMPSTAADAAGMLNAAFKSGRPTLFFYPKNCLNDRAQTTSTDLADHLTPIGRARHVRRGDNLTLIGWGNTVALLTTVAEHVAEAGVACDVIDLRSISPWDKSLVLDSARRSRQVLVAHEDNETCGFGSEIISTINQSLDCHVKTRLVARADTYVPCNFANQLDVLPSVRSIFTAAAELCDLDLEWHPDIEVSSDVYVMNAIGSSPADEVVQIVSLWVKEGDSVSAGAPVADAESDKAAVELAVPVTGLVERILVEEGQSVQVGAPIMEVRLAKSTSRQKPQIREQLAKFTLSAKETAKINGLEISAPAHMSGGQGSVFVSKPSTTTGSRRVTNDELATRFPEYDADDIKTRTGIEERLWLAEDEDLSQLAARAVQETLDRHELSLTDIDLLVCSNSCPDFASPTLSARIAGALSGEKTSLPMCAFDLNAACTGYLHGLSVAYDFVRNNPKGKVVVVTAEALSGVLNPEDFGTSILFGDAATATLVRAGDGIGTPGFKLNRPVSALKPDEQNTIIVPSPKQNSFLEMKGERTFSEAVREMHKILETACAENCIGVSDLDILVPHQANQRIIDAVGRRMKNPNVEVFSNIRTLGNTSSCSIPICLNQMLDDRSSGETLALVSFGAGYTMGSAIMTVT